MNTNNENNELNSIEFPTLSKLDRKNNFTVGETFFEKQLVEIQQKCYSQTQSTSMLRKPALHLKWVVVAGVLVIFVSIMSIYMFNGKQKIELANNTITQEVQLADLIDYDDIEENTIVNVILEEDTITNINNTKASIDTTALDVSDDDIIKYLIEEGYDLENN